MTDRPRAPGKERYASLVRGIVAVVWLVGLVGLTLTPAGGPVHRIVSACLVCGQRGAADAMLNVVLFLPLGILVGARRSAAFALATGLALSVAVELGQLVLAGRYSNVGDLVWNGLGAYLGGMLAPALRARVRGRGSIAAPLAAVCLPLGWILVAGALLRPTPVLESAALAEDIERVTTMASTAVVGRSRAAQPPEDASVRRVELERHDEAGWRLSAEILPAPPSRDLSPIASIQDPRIGTIRVLGRDRGDLVLWERTPGESLGFDRANLRLPGGAPSPDRPGPVMVSASETAQGLVCLRSGATAMCGLGVSPARTWTLLRSREDGSRRLKLAVDIAWMATLTALIGLLGGRARPTLSAAGGFLLVLWMAPHVTSLVQGGWPELVGTAMGITVGLLARPVVRLAT